MMALYLLPFACCLIGLSVAQLIRHNALALGLVDVPSARSSHSTPTPRGGGLGIVIAMELAALALLALKLIDFRFWLLMGGGGAVIGVLGFIDDRRSLRSLTRLAVHVAVASISAWVICHMREGAGMAGGIPMGIILGLILVWGINSFNFMDGIDGIAAAQALFMAVAGASLNAFLGGPLAATMLLSCLAAAVLGFLFLNWPPAKIFMGDGASGFLGYALSLFAVAPVESSRFTLPVWIILGGLFVADAGVTLLRRAARRERVFEAHRLHAYQHLSRRWQSHLAVTGLYATVNITWLLPWAFYAASHAESASWVLTVALGPLVILLLLVGAGRQERA